MAKNIENKNIYSYSGYGSMCTIFVANEKKTIIDNKELKWNGDIEEEYLSLKEISKQLRELGYQGVYCVWAESPLGGTIYQCGNYIENKWIEYGTTIGYA